MAVAAVRPRAHYERGFARSHERRSPQAGVSSTVAPFPATPVTDGTKATSTPEAASTVKLPTDVKALAGVITVLGLFILAFAIWKIRAWRLRRINAVSDVLPTSNEKQIKTHIHLESAVYMEKPTKAVLKPTIPPASAGVGWVPQLRADIALPEPTRKRSQRSKKAWEKNLAKFIAPTIPEREPPPYAPRVMPPMPAMPVSPPSQALPPTPPAALKLSFDGIIPPLPAQKPTNSPARTSSYGPHPALAPRLSSSSRRSDRKLPRLMTVANAFDPSMEDELCVAVGETLRLLEEYEDEWCLAQRVGRIDAEKGVIPRFCLMERPEVVPSHPGLPSSGSHRR